MENEAEEKHIFSGVAVQVLNLRALSPQGSALPAAPHPDALFLALSHNFIRSVVTCFCITLTTLFVYVK